MILFIIVSIINEIFKFIIIAPVVVILKLIIPTCNVQIPNEGWSKLLVAINMLLVIPATIYFSSHRAHKWALETINGIPIYVIISIPGLIASAVVIFFTKVTPPPRWNWVLAFIGFPVAIVVVNYCCNAIVELLDGFGTRIGIAYSTLGMTLLAWGNSLGDLVSNTTLAKNGIPKMAFAACFGSPLFTCIFGAGVTSMVSLITAKETQSKVKLGLTGGLVTFFILTSLICSLIMLPLMDMDGRRSYGFFLITLYFTFCGVVILAEVFKGT